MSWRSRGPHETRALGRGLARSVGEEGAVVALVGELGTGKTVLAQGVAEGLDLAPGVLASPTFVIANEVETPVGRRLVHADLYRLVAADEAEAAGLEDWLAPGTLLIVEWGDRFPGVLPVDRVEVHLSRGAAEEERRIEARAGGPASEALCARWRARCP